ncbi:MAG: MBL fold metallo-hydrolase [candidate division Zixibacteria bacterium]|nr:MBL fold metallo-hydrolase [candidate division Zixibacteria bacterium]
MRKCIILLIIFILSNLPIYANELVIHCLNIGQGDCTLIQSPSGMNIMVDSGPPSSQWIVLNYLRNYNISHLEYIITTHYHADHIGGVNAIIEASDISVSKVYDRGWDYCSWSYENYYEPSVEDIRHTIVDGQILDLGGGVEAKVVSVNGNEVLNEPYRDAGCPPDNGPNNENDFSVSLVIDYDDFQFFVGGDLSGLTNGTYTDIETSVAPEVGDVEIYRVNHHGSYASSNQFFLNTTDPEVSVISVGQNGYGHPHTETMQRLLATSIVYQTADGEGNPVDDHIVIRTPGQNNYTVNGDFYYIGSDESIPISDIQTDYDNYQDRPVTIEGVITIGTGILNPYSTDAYIQDSSGMGINLFDLGLIEDFQRSYRVKVSGIVGEYEGVTLIQNISNYEIISTDNDLPFGRYYPTGSVNDFDYEGSRIRTFGEVTELSNDTDGDRIRIDDGSGSCLGFCPSAANVNIDWIEIGETIMFFGVLRVNAVGADTSYSALLTDNSDVISYTDVVEYGEINIPEEVTLQQNYPNPFNASTSIGYSLSKPANVQLIVYNIKGQEIATLIDRFQSSGEYSIGFDASNYASGIYYYRLQAGDKSIIKKMTLIK